MDRRSAERVVVDLPITMSVHRGSRAWTETDAEIVDLSHGGMFVRCDRVPSGGGRILVCINSETKGLCAATGDSVRIDERGGFGVQFKRINAAMTDLLNERRDKQGFGKDVPDAQIWVD